MLLHHRQHRQLFDDGGANLSIIIYFLCICFFSKESDTPQRKKSKVGSILDGSHDDSMSSASNSDNEGSDEDRGVAKGRISREATKAAKIKIKGSLDER